ncbi:MAG TPA: zf-HC2 domain-containing protein [Candidatus Aquilonibacter sp.]|nr:zf-HC2 domain-containing protein [Candidatus Aquilonibacter sp.]
MEHAEAVRIKAAEQYLLGELTPELREAFEEHFMSCQECARDVRAGMVFVASAKEVLRTQFPAPETAVPVKKRRSWLEALLRPAIMVPAFAALIAVIAYQEFVAIPRLEMKVSRTSAPISIASFSLLGGSSRGAASVPVVVEKDTPFTLYVDVPPQPSFPAYSLDVEDAGGAEEFSVPVSGEAAKSTVQIFVPPARLLPGDYVLVIRGGSGEASQGPEVGRFRFSLQYTQQ